MLKFTSTLWRQRMLQLPFFSERELSLYVVVRPSVCLSVCLSVTFVHFTQVIEIIGNLSMSFDTVATH